MTPADHPRSARLALPVDDSGAASLDQRLGSTEYEKGVESTIVTVTTQQMRRRRAVDDTLLPEFGSGDMNSKISAIDLLVPSTMQIAQSLGRVEERLHHAADRAKTRVDKLHSLGSDNEAVQRLPLSHVRMNAVVESVIAVCGTGRRQRVAALDVYPANSNQVATKRPLLHSLIKPPGGGGGWAALRRYHDQ